MRIANLIPTHNSVRSLEVMEQWRIRFKQGIVLRCNPLVVHSCTCCSRQYLHDGHHRAVALIKAGGTVLYEDEFVVKRANWCKLYNEINPLKDWLTPFNPVEEVRKSDVLYFKESIRRILSVNETLRQNGYKEQDIEETIRNRSLEYKENRIANTLYDFSD